MPTENKKQKAESLFLATERAEERGDLRSAFHLLLVAAKLGDVGAQLNLGNYYDDGTGVRRNRSAALYWFKRAYRRRYSSAAHNIGIVWRNENKPARSLSWFRRAVKLGDDESNIDIAKHYWFNEKNPRRAIPYLKRIRLSKWVSEAGLEEAAALLTEAQRQLRKRQARHSN